MLFHTGDQVGVSVKGRMVAGPAIIIGINRELTYMYDIRWPNGEKVGVINYDLFPYWNQLKIGDLVPTHIPLRKMLYKRRLDQMVRDIFEWKGQDAEPGGPADIIRECLGVSAPKGCGRLSSDVGRRWKRQKN
jgi:hypothetical protein